MPGRRGAAAPGRTLVPAISAVMLARRVAKGSSMGSGPRPPRCRPVPPPSPTAPGAYHLTGAPLDATEWNAHRALDATEWHGRALRTRRPQPRASPAAYPRVCKDVWSRVTEPPSDAPSPRMRGRVSWWHHHPRIRGGIPSCDRVGLRDPCVMAQDPHLYARSL